jgi:predicted naringenin-chalcone synthase
MERDIFIHSFRPVLPSHCLPQNETVSWVLNAHQRHSELTGTEFSQERSRHFALNEHHIKQRYFESDDIDFDWAAHEIYKLIPESPQGTSIGHRNHFFGARTQKILKQIYEHHTPAHLIHVTCTGYLSPSPAQVYFSGRDKAPDITHAYHMGCYASLPAVRMGMGIHLINGEEVDILHTEMCSLHLDPSQHSAEQFVVQSLFADGHIKYSIGRNNKGLKIIRVKEKMIPDSSECMTWLPDAYGMKMTLSKEVPFKIRDALPEFIKELNPENSKNIIFAIHPGGPKIIEAVQKKMELSDEQVVHSKKILFERGNMSSATLPHVWNEILSDGVENGTKVIALAFGPGLTIFGSLFEVAR